MKVEAVTVSIGFADFLKVTLPHNLPLFDRIVVVTSPDDVPTRELCRKLGIKMVYNVGRGGKVQSSSWLVQKLK